MIRNESSNYHQLKIKPSLSRQKNAEYFMLDSYDLQSIILEKYYFLFYDSF